MGNAPEQPLDLGWAGGLRQGKDRSPFLRLMRNSQPNATCNPRPAGPRVDFVFCLFFPTSSDVDDLAWLTSSVHDRADVPYFCLCPLFWLFSTARLVGLASSFTHRGQPSAPVIVFLPAIALLNPTCLRSRLSVRHAIFASPIRLRVASHPREPSLHELRLVPEPRAPIGGHTRNHGSVSRCQSTTRRRARSRSPPAIPAPRLVQAEKQAACNWAFSQCEGTPRLALTPHITSLVDAGCRPPPEVVAVLQRRVKPAPCALTRFHRSHGRLSG